jgi:poly-D-alanine transfer protein DltD
MYQTNVTKPTAREVWDSVRRSPRYDDMVMLIEAMYTQECEVYINTPANEFTRGKVVALRDTLTFLTTGETA